MFFPHFSHIFPIFFPCPGLTVRPAGCRGIPPLAQRPAVGGAAPPALRLRRVVDVVDDGVGAGQRRWGGGTGGGSTWAPGG